MQLSKEEIQELIELKIKSAERQYGKDIKFLLMEILSLEKMLAPEAINEKKPRVIPLTEWNEYHPYPSVGALRQYKFYKNTNGFDKVLEYGGANGGRILINEDKFFEWQRQRKNKDKDVS